MNPILTNSTFSPTLKRKKMKNLRFTSTMNPILNNSTFSPTMKQKKNEEFTIYPPNESNSK